MKKGFRTPLSLIAAVLCVLLWSGCQSAPVQPGDNGKSIPSTPYSKGPDGPPNSKGPNGKFPDMSALSAKTPISVTESEQTSFKMTQQ